MATLAEDADKLHKDLHNAADCEYLTPELLGELGMRGERRGLDAQVDLGVRARPLAQRPLVEPSSQIPRAPSPQWGRMPSNTLPPPT